MKIISRFYDIAPEAFKEVIGVPYLPVTFFYAVMLSQLNKFKNKLADIGTRYIKSGANGRFNILNRVKLLRRKAASDE